jgi:hypothetical protein
MAERLVIISDLSGKSPAARYQLGRPGHGFEIDLTEEEAGEMFSALAPWVPLARPLLEPQAPAHIVRSTTQRQRQRVRGDGQWARMRAWAIRQGMEVSSQGPLPNAVIDAYRQAHPNGPEQEAASA